MKPIDVFEKMANLDDDLIDAATLPESAATPTRAGGIRHRLVQLSDFFNRPAVVAAACVLVTFGVLAGIIAAGRMGGNYKSDATIGYPEDDRPNYSVDAEHTVEENAEEKDSNLSDGFGSSAGVNPPEEDVSEPATGEDSEIALPDVMPSVPTVVINVAAGNRGTNLYQYVVGYSGTVFTADGEVNMEMDGPGARQELESLVYELATVHYEGALTVTLPRTCTPRDWVMYNEDFVVLDQSENFDKLPDAVALMNGPMEGAESHCVYIVLAVDYKYGQDRGIFEYAFRVQFGDEGENLDTTPADPEADSTIANEGWGTDTPDDLPDEETKVSWEDDKVITPSETLKMVADGERSVYPYARLIYVGSRDEDTGEWVSDTMDPFVRWAPENAPNYINELPVLTWQGGDLKVALRFEDRMTVKHLAVYYPDLTYIDTVYDPADLKAFGWGQYLVIAEVHRQEADEEFVYEHVFVLERETVPTPAETEAPAAEYIPSSKYVTYENDRYILTTPLYGKRILFDKYNAHYVDDIDDALVEAAERTIVEQASQYDDEIYLYFETLYEDGRLYMAIELIVPAPPEEAAGCGDHKHLVFREPITR